MNFSDLITIVPLPYQPSLGAEVLAEHDGLPNAFQSLLKGTAGCSPYLAGLITRETVFLQQICEAAPNDLLDTVLQDVQDLTLPDLKSGFRSAKRRVALLTALADLGGVWALEDVTQALTRLADTCLARGLDLLVRQALDRKKLPETAAQGAGGMCILAMGKMGARELNYSSDIDLICLFDETRFEPDDYAEARAGFVRITRSLMSLMSEITEDGYVFRTDLRLRPDASVTPVCIAMEAAERYYESVGRTWERAAFIKARPCAGDIAAGERFLKRLEPFIWRKHLDFAAIEDAHDMRLRIRDHKGLGGAFALEGHNMKLGTGGIREIEFFTQTQQVIAGGRDPSLRKARTVDGLAALADANWIPPELAQKLTRHYRDHRKIEHRLQMIGDAQTHNLPSDPDGFDRLARFMGVSDTEDFKTELSARIQDVVASCDGFFRSDAPEEETNLDSYLDRWRKFPALRSPRAIDLFRRIFPGALALMESSARPDEAIAGFESFLAGLPAGVQVFSLFEANPQLIELIVDICSTSPALADYLSRNSAVLDAVIAGDFFTDWSGTARLTAELADHCAQAVDYEAKLDATRRWQKEWHFRIGVHHLRGLNTPEMAASQYAELAEAVVSVLLDVVKSEIARRYGLVSGRGAMVLAMGSLGAGQLNAGSDLDLIVIYDALVEDVSDGPKSLPARSYYAKLTQTFVTALTAPTAEGKLYQVDMRLRPSGKAGPVATSLRGFENYQRKEAWTWEHLALTRARAIAGEASLCQDVETIRTELLQRARSAPVVLKEMTEMRARLEAAKPATAKFDLKPGPGGMQDIELFAQSAALISGTLDRHRAKQIGATIGLGWLSERDAIELTEVAALFQKAIVSAALLTDTPQALEQPVAGAETFLLRETAHSSMPALFEALEQGRARAILFIEAVLEEVVERK